MQGKNMKFFHVKDFMQKKENWKERYNRKR